MEVILFSLYAVVVFIIQLVLCLKTKRIIVKFLPTIVLAFLAFMLYIAAVEFGRTTEGLESLGMLVYLAFMVYALLGIVVCALAFITYRIVRAIQIRTAYYDSYDYNYSDVDDDDDRNDDDRDD